MGTTFVRNLSIDHCMLHVTLRRRRRRRRRTGSHCEIQEKMKSQWGITSLAPPPRRTVTGMAFPGPLPPSLGTSARDAGTRGLDGRKTREKQRAAGQNDSTACEQRCYYERGTDRLVPNTLLSGSSRARNALLLVQPLHAKIGLVQRTSPEK